MASYTLKAPVVQCTILKTLFIVMLGLCCSAANATVPDSLIVTNGTDGWNILQKVSPGETIFSLARRFHVPPSILAEANGKTYGDGLSIGSYISVPLGAYNMLNEPPRTMEEARPIFYRMTATDKLYHISREANISMSTLSAWNRLSNNEAPPGKMLLVGWVRYDATPIAPPAAAMTSNSQIPAIVRHDTPKYVMGSIDTFSLPPVEPPVVINPTLGQLWKEQTVDGANAVVEKGSVGFYTVTGHAAGANIFAFSNTAPRGTVMRVRNLNNGHYIYVKVLGPLPDTKPFAGCILGLSNAAKSALGVRETKAFCELSYMGY
jgi:LysM repeat protein